MRGRARARGAAPPPRSGAPAPGAAPRHPRPRICGELERALAEAIAQRLATADQVHAALERAASNHPGAAVLRSLLAHQTGVAFTQSAAERKLLPLLLAAQLPVPQVNARVCGYAVDLYWPEHALIVEVDGYQFHHSKAMFESDRKRDQILVAAGYRVIRVTWRQLVEEPLAVIARIALSLRAAAGREPRNSQNPPVLTGCHPSST